MNYCELFTWPTRVGSAPLITRKIIAL